MSTALELAAVRKSFGNTEIIAASTSPFRKGERHALIGPNGAGKSTLFNLVSGRFPCSTARIRLNGEDITGLKPFQINRPRPVAQLPDHQHLPQPVGVREPALRGALVARLQVLVLASPGRPRGRAPARRRVLAAIGLEARRDRPAGLLTYAEQRALEIGITIAGGADVILLTSPPRA
jgi:branched-chain amino acid transport system ATP-binding protein